jgi:hypothetical protein
MTGMTVKHYFSTSRILLLLLTMLLPIWVQAGLAEEEALLQQLQQAASDAKSSLQELEGDLTYFTNKANSKQAAWEKAQAAADKAQADLDAAQASGDLAAVQDAKYQFTLKQSKQETEKKGFDRAQRKQQEVQAEINNLKQQLSTTDASIAEQQAKVDALKGDSEPTPSATAEADSDQEQQAAAKAEADKAAEETKAAAEAAAKAEADAAAEQQAAAEAKAAKEKAAAEKAAAEVRAAEEAKAAATRAAAEKQKQQQTATVKTDPNCIALPSEPTNPSTELSPLDMQLKAYAQGEQKRVARMVEEAAGDDTPPLSDPPALMGSMLKPCQPAQVAALNFNYLGNGQYQLETPLLAGEQTFWIDGVVDPIRRIIPDTDNGVTFTFFLDARNPGRYKLVNYKSSLLQAP